MMKKMRSIIDFSISFNYNFTLRKTKMLKKNEFIISYILIYLYLKLMKSSDA